MAPGLLKFAALRMLKSSRFASTDMSLLGRNRYANFMSPGASWLTAEPTSRGYCWRDGTSRMSRPVVETRTSNSAGLVTGMNVPDPYSASSSGARNV